MKIPLFIFSLSIILLLQPSYQVKIQLPVSQLTIAKLTLSIDKLEDLLQYFNTKDENKQEIYRRVQLTKGYLDEMRIELGRNGNVINGNANSVNGQKNVVIGNYNQVDGNNNWVFVSKFNGKINGQLLVSDWMIDLQKSSLIIKSPRLAISYIDEEKNLALKAQIQADKRQFCKWGNWTRPDNKKSDRHWRNYVGYDEWKIANWDKKNLRVNLDDVESWQWANENTAIGGGANQLSFSSSSTTSGWTTNAVSSNTGNTFQFTSGSGANGFTSSASSPVASSSSGSALFTLGSSSGFGSSSTGISGWSTASGQNLTPSWLQGWNIVK